MLFKGKIGVVLKTVERKRTMKRKILPVFLALVMLFGAVFLPCSAEKLTNGAAELAKDTVLIKSGYLGETLKFCENDFKTALGAAKISSITVASLPDESTGTLYLASSRLSRGQNVSAAVLDLLKFIPKDKSIEEASFTFTAENLAGGAEIPCRIRFLDKKNEAPTVGEISFTVATQRDISYFGTLGGSDPEADALYFRITSYPKHGTLTMLDAESGDFRYTPTEGYTGKDKFSYVVRDEYGNYSKEEQVSVNVQKRSSELVYEDIAGTKTELAAIALTDAGIMLGRLSGDGMYFDEELAVSRGEFTVMAMKAAAIAPIEGLTTTFFDDDAEIPTSIKSYIATAQSKGFINGSFDGTGLYFEPNRNVTKAEAAVILCNIMNLSAGDSTAVFAGEDDVPVWAEKAVATLYTLGAMDAEETGVWNVSDVLTRGDAAHILYTVMQ